MLDDLVRVIETLRERIRTHGATLRENETRTRMALIDPLLTALGWDVTDPSVVTPEYNVSGKRADYALLGRNGVVVFLEAKKLDEPLSNHRSQIVAYAGELGIKFPALTNGNAWEVYDNSKLVPIDQRRILNLSITDVLPHQCALQLLLLWRPNLSSGQPVEAAEPLFVPPTPSAPEAPSHAPTLSSTPSPAPPIEPGWVSLSEFNPPTGATPPARVRFPDENVQEVKNWRTLVVETIKWLWSEHLLTQDNLPVPRGPNSKQYIVNIEPVHGTGTNFHHSVSIAGTPLFFDGNVGVSAPDRVRTLLQRCNVDPATVHLQVAE